MPTSPASMRHFLAAEPSLFRQCRELVCPLHHHHQKPRGGSPNRQRHARTPCHWFVIDALRYWSSLSCEQSRRTHDTDAASQDARHHRNLYLYFDSLRTEQLPLSPTVETIPEVGRYGFDTQSSSAARFTLAMIASLLRARRSRRHGPCRCGQSMLNSRSGRLDEQSL